MLDKIFSGQKGMFHDVALLWVQGGPLEEVSWGIGTLFLLSPESELIQSLVHLSWEHWVIFSLLMVSLWPTRISSGSAWHYKALVVWSWPGSAIPAILWNLFNTPVSFFINSRTDQMSLLWLGFPPVPPFSKALPEQTFSLFPSLFLPMAGAVLNRGLVLFLLALTEPSKESGVVVIWIYHRENTEVWKVNAYSMVGTKNLWKELRIIVPRWLQSEENLTCVSRGVRKESHIRKLGGLLWPEDSNIRAAILWVLCFSIRIRRCSCNPHTLWVITILLMKMG